MPPDVLVVYRISIDSPTNQSRAVSHYSMLSGTSKSLLGASPFTQSNSTQFKLRCNPNSGVINETLMTCLSDCETQTTNALTAANLIYAIGAGITAAAGTRLALQSILAHFCKLCSLQSRSISVMLLFFVTTSPFRDWVICAPAATLRCGSRLSGSLSGIEPQFPVTRNCLGKPIPHRQSW